MGDNAADLRTLRDFGRVEAERDFDADYFIPSRAWTTVRRATRPIVLGRKGAGKTAIREALKNETYLDPEIFVSHLSLGDYPWALHDEIADPAMGSKGRYLAGWTFLILVELTKLVVVEDQSDRSGQPARVAEGLRAFLEKNWGELTFDPKATFEKLEYKISGGIRPSAAGFSIGGIEWSPVERNRLRQRLAEMNDWLRSGLEVVIRTDAHYFVVFDGLDLDYAVDNRQLQDSIIGLLRAAETVFDWLRDLDLRTAPIVLVRDDVFENLDFADRNKMQMDSTIEIRWASDPDGEDNLRELMAARIRALLDVPAQQDAWDAVFDRTALIDDVDLYRYITVRTFNRPRDIIVFSNECLRQAQNRLRRGVGEPVIGAEDVRSAEDRYSTYLRDEIRDEMAGHYPAWSDWLEVIRDIGKPEFDSDTFGERCKHVVTEGVTLEQILERLYEFSVIGYLRDAGGRDPYFRYLDPAVPFNRRAGRFVVHPGLNRVLDLAKP
jgi:hypothetical protein